MLRCLPPLSYGSLCFSGESRGEQVVGGAVGVVAAPVVAAGGAGVGVAEGVLHVLQRQSARQRLVAKACRKVCGLVRSADASPAARARRRSWEWTLR